MLAFYGVVHGVAPAEEPPKEQADSRWESEVVWVVRVVEGFRCCLCCCCYRVVREENQNLNLNLNLN